MFSRTLGSFKILDLKVRGVVHGQFWLLGSLLGEPKINGKPKTGFFKKLLAVNKDTAILVKIH